MKVWPFAPLLFPTLVFGQQQPILSPNAEVVYATSITVAPGAIVCKDLPTVNAMLHAYGAHWEESSRKPLTEEQSTSDKGAPSPIPDLKLFGCALVAPGTKMTLHKGNFVSVVSFKLANGQEVRGVTMAVMLSTVEPTKPRSGVRAAIPAPYEKRPEVQRVTDAAN